MGLVTYRDYDIRSLHARNWYLYTYSQKQNDVDLAVYMEIPREVASARISGYFGREPNLATN